MLWRSTRKALAPQQYDVAMHHFARLLKRWEGNLDQSRQARLWANARCLALHPERCSSEWGERLRRQRGAKAAHVSMRAKGRTPGDQGRAVIERNGAERTEQKRRDKIAQLSAVTTAAKGPDGLTAEQREANRMIVEGAAEVEKARVERLAREWRDKQERLRAPKRLSGRAGLAHQS